MAPELQTLITALLPSPCAVRLTEVTVEQASVRLQLTATAPTAACPRCTVSSSSIHSHYQRHLTDLPWGTRAVHLQLTVRKFLCRNPTFARRIFTERLPALVAALRARGTPIATMAPQSGISRPTVYAYLRRDTPPGPRQPQRRPSARVLTPYTGPQGPSARAVLFAMVCPAAQRSPGAQAYIDPLCQMDTDIARAHGLIQAFPTMVRERRGNHLEAWMAEAVHSGVEALARFARRLQEDLPGIKAGLTLEWNNRVTEGQIHRLKLVKRQGYGKAGFALLRQRVLQAA